MPIVTTVVEDPTPPILTYLELANPQLCKPVRQIVDFSGVDNLVPVGTYSLLYNFKAAAPYGGAGLDPVIPGLRVALFELGGGMLDDTYPAAVLGSNTRVIAQKSVRTIASGNADPGKGIQFLSASVFSLNALPVPLCQFMGFPMLNLPGPFPEQFVPEHRLDFYAVGMLNGSTYSGRLEIVYLLVKD